MPRQKNPENVYNFTCAVTRENVHTNPQQFQDLMDRYGVTSDELIKSYVSRNGRNQLKAEGLSKEDAIARYNLHPKIADCLKILNKKRTVSQRKKKVVAEPVSADPVNADPVTDEDESPIFIASEEEEDSAVVAEIGEPPH